MKILINTTLILLLLFSSYSLMAQEETKNLSETGFIANYSEDGGNVNITQDSRLSDVLTNHIISNKSRPVMGWRVQIYFGQGQSAKAKAENVKKTFLKKYPDVSAYLIYEAPYFKVRVGNYKTKFEARKMKVELEGQFDKIFLIEDKIKLNPDEEENENEEDIEDNE